MGFILLKTFANYIEANIALSMLEEEGINCHLEDENTVTMMSMSSGIRLMVYDSQAERAAEVIKEAEIEYLNYLSCPDCHSSGFEIRYVTENHADALKKIPFGRIIALLSRTLTKEGTNMQVKHYVCNNCHKEFDDIPS
jgi:Zn finger protein HypA/HybF involved in hydrogenase expression